MAAVGGSTILHVSEDINGTGWCVSFLGLSSLGEIVAVGLNGSSVQLIGPILIVDQLVHVAEAYSQTNHDGRSNNPY